MYSYKHTHKTISLTGQKYSEGKNVNKQTFTKCE